MTTQTPTPKGDEEQEMTVEHIEARARELLAAALDEAGGFEFSARNVRKGYGQGPAPTSQRMLEAALADIRAALARAGQCYGRGVRVDGETRAKLGALEVRECPICGDKPLTIPCPECGYTGKKAAPLRNGEG